MTTTDQNKPTSRRIADTAAVILVALGVAGVASIALVFAWAAWQDYKAFRQLEMAGTSEETSMRYSTSDKGANRR